MASARSLLLPLSETAFGGLRGTIVALEAEEARPDRSVLICQGLLHVLLAQIQRCMNQQAGAARPTRCAEVLCKQLQALLETHYLAKLIPADYAIRLVITSHHLNAGCTAVAGGVHGQRSGTGQVVARSQAPPGLHRRASGRRSGRAGLSGCLVFRPRVPGRNGAASGACQKAMSEKNREKDAAFQPLGQEGGYTFTLSSTPIFYAPFSWKNWPF